jgi:low temperature requirement protein LtrA
MTTAPDPAETPEKRVSWAELFFDLVFVFSVTEVSSLILHDYSWAGLLRALVVFVPIYWLWVGTAIQTNQRDVNAPILRLRIFAVALSAIFMALALPSSYADSGLLFALAYWCGRLLLGLGFLVGGLRRKAVPWTPYTVSILFTGPLLVIGALLPAHWREAVWGFAALLDLATPTLQRRRLSTMHLDAGHLAERFGLFVLIAIGESVVAIGTSATSEDGPSLAVGSAVLAAFALSAGLWWVYFHFAADAMRHAMATAAVQTNITRLVLSYGHLSFIGSVIVVSVGMHEAVGHPEARLGSGSIGLLFGGTAMFLATFGFTRWAMFRLVSTTRLTAALGVLLLAVPAAFVPALVAVAALALLLVVLNAVELARVQQIGWRALLAGRSG